RIAGTNGSDSSNEARDSCLRRSLVETRCDLRNLSTQFPRLKWRWSWRHQWHHFTARLLERSWRGRDLDHPNVSVAASGLWIRRRGLRIDRSAIWYACRFRSFGGGGEKTQHPHHHGLRSESHL